MKWVIRINEVGHGMGQQPVVLVVVGLTQLCAIAVACQEYQPWRTRSTFLSGLDTSENLCSLRLGWERVTTTQQAWSNDVQTNLWKVTRRVEDITNCPATWMSFQKMPATMSAVGGWLVCAFQPSSRTRSWPNQYPWKCGLVYKQMKIREWDRNRSFVKFHSASTSADE